MAVTRKCPISLLNIYINYNKRWFDKVLSSVSVRLFESEHVHSVSLIKTYTLYNQTVPACKQP